MSNPSCAFVWHDLITTDVEGAKAFYAKVIGWSMQAFEGAADYTVLTAGTVGLGGIMPMPAQACERGAPACWQGYIGVPDVDACAQRIQASGGSVVQPPQDIPQVGRFALVADPQGAVFIIFKPLGGQTMPAAAPGTAGLVGWNELHAANGLQAFDWYAEQFGWTLAQDMDMGPLGVYRLFATGAEPAGGMMTKMPDMPTPFWAYYFNVPSIGAALERVVQAGGKVLHGPQEVPGPMFIANCQDPQGAWFSLVAPQ
jgi:predicted enzyme related to lactoylglutathione lyase